MVAALLSAVEEVAVADDSLMCSPTSFVGRSSQVKQDAPWHCEGQESTEKERTVSLTCASLLCKGRRNKMRTAKITLFSTLLSLCLVWLNGTASAYEWEKTFGGSYDDSGYSVQQTTDGGYIIAGYIGVRIYVKTGGFETDVYLIKTDAAGNELWSKTFGGSYDESGYSVQQTTDGGYIIAGYTYSFGAGLTDVYLIKTDTDGNELWSQTFGGARDDEAYSVQQTTDGGYIIAGGTNSFGAGETDVYLIKTDADGNELWSKTLGGSSAGHWGRSVQQTTDGGYIIAGGTSLPASPYSDAYLIKTDDSGNELWSKTFAESDRDEFFSVQQTTDGGYIIAGITDVRSAGETDVYLIKTDTDGNELWSKTFGGSGIDWAYSVQQTTDGGYIIAGSTSSFGAGESDAYLIKTDADGNELWSKTFGGSETDSIAKSVQQTSEGAYIVAGSIGSSAEGGGDAYLIYYRPNPEPDPQPGPPAAGGGGGGGGGGG
jgi:hypothetical protein